MKKALLIGTILAIIGGFWWLKPAAEVSALADAETQFTDTIDNVLADSTSLVTSGLVGAGGTDTLPARTAGRVKNIFFARGDYARREQILVKLENYTYVAAPRAGFLGDCQVVIGQYITAKTPVASLSNRSYLVVSVVLPNPRGAGIQPGDSARVWTTYRRLRTAMGTVEAIGAPNPAGIPLEIRLSSRAPFRLGELIKRPAARQAPPINRPVIRCKIGRYR